MPDPFVHLHCHSEFSLLDGLGRVNDLVGAAAEASMPALALTDHGTMFGAVDFYSKAREVGVKPILGCEVYVADRPLTEKADATAQNYHLVLLAENESGYRNLIKLTTEAHLQGFYRKPRVDHALLESHSDGLICLSACANGEVARLIRAENVKGAEEKADWYRSVFSDRYYLELQDHSLDFQKQINSGVIDLSKRLGLPLVATNDVHYVQERQAYAHEVLLCIQTQTTMSDPKRMRFETQEFYLKPAEAMSSLFSNYPEAISNTVAIADRCNLELAFGKPQLPRFETPGGQSSNEYLRSLCEEGVLVRYGEVSDEVRARLDYELSVVSDIGFAEFYLLVHDVIRYARSVGITVGPGRGSAAASIIAYILYITNIDPLTHGLSFERFLNPARITMPDFDLDFADDRRDEVIQYVTRKYGRDRVAQIITFGTLGARAGVRDVGRCLGMSYADVDRVAKLVPFMTNKISKARDEVVDLQRLYDSDPAMQQLMDTVEDVEGVARHASTHAAGVVIARDELTEQVPLYRVPKTGQITTQYTMSAVEKLGLLKVDFLGLRTLTILERASRFVRESTGQELKLDDIPLDDPGIYQLLSSGETFGVFQVDGSGMRRLLRDLKPEEFKHIVAVNALYRPGPMEHIDEFVARKNGFHEVSYIHPALEEVLEETYGIVVYQDQVMRLAGKVAGYSMGEADLLRRAMGKKKPQELAVHRETFIERAANLGTAPETARLLFDIIEPFAGYAFNKAHAAAYAVITCQTAYLKAHFPRQYMAGLLSAEKENADKVAEAMSECRRLHIAIQGPDVNHSAVDFKLEGEGIRFGLGAIKHVGSGAIEVILDAREKAGPFASLNDFCNRVDWAVMNKRMLESLIKCGALDCFGMERKRLYEGLDRLVAFGIQTQRAAASGQVSLFGEIEQEMVMLQLPLTDAATLEEKLSWELELLGTYISPHPLARAEEALKDTEAIGVDDVGDDQHGQRIQVGGIVQEVRSFSTKQGQRMGSFKLSDLRSKLEVLVFSRAYEQLQAKMVENEIVIVEGKFDAQEGRVRLLADTIRTVEEARERLSSGDGNKGEAGRSRRPSEKPIPFNRNGSAKKVNRMKEAPQKLSIVFERTPDRDGDMDRIMKVYAAIQSHPGQDEVEIKVRQDDKVRTVPLPCKGVAVSKELEAQLRQLLPEGSWESLAPHTAV